MNTKNIQALLLRFDLVQDTSPAGAPPVPAGRNHAIDLMKGLLVIAMILSHIQAGLYLPMPWLEPWRWVIQLVAFSGFMFAFGYTTCKAYLDRPVLPWRHMLITLLKILIAYLLTAFAYGFFNDHQLSVKFMLSVIRFDTLARNGEFLLTYIVILILLLIIPGFFRFVVRKQALFWPLVGVLLLTTFIDYSRIHSAFLSIFIGIKTMPSFPVVQYMPLYLFGVYFARRNIRFSWKYLAGSLLALAAFLVAQAYGWVSRFPPTLLWIIGSMGIVYLCFLISFPLTHLNFLGKPLMEIGKHTLYWLVMSNLFIDVMYGVLRLITLPAYWVAILVIAGYVSIGFLSYLSRN